MFEHATFLFRFFFKCFKYVALKVKKKVKPVRYNFLISDKRLFISNVIDHLYSYHHDDAYNSDIIYIDKNNPHTKKCDKNGFNSHTNVQSNLISTLSSVVFVVVFVNFASHLLLKKFKFQVVIIMFAIG